MNIITQFALSFLKIGGMKEDLVKILIAAVFIKGKKEFALSKNKTDLARKLSKTPELYKRIGYKTLLNYFEYYFQSGKEVNPNQEKIYTLLKYLNFQSEKQFRDNPPTIDFKEVPFVIEKNTGSGTGKGSGAFLLDNPFILRIVTTIVLVAIVITSFVISNSPEAGTKKNQVATSVRIYPLKKTDFFSATQEPLVWYSKVEDQIECYSTKGNHPITGEKLKLVTQEIMDEYLKKYKDIMQYSRIKIVQDGHVNYMMSYYFKGIYRKVYERYICDGMMRVTYDADSLKQDKFIVCNLTFTYTVKSLATKKLLDSDTISLSGLGTTKPFALKDAIYNLTFE
jgi:hypothetical protein